MRHISSLPGYRRLFSVPSLIGDMMKGSLVDFDLARVERELFLSERRSDVRYPDYLYKKSICGQRTQNHWVGLGDAIVGTLRMLNEEMVEWRGRHLYVKRDEAQHWIDTTARVSPLLLRVVAMREKFGPLPVSDENERADFVQAKFLPALGHSMVIAPYDTAFQHIVETQGLAESHMHLNGTTETDIVWIDILENRRNVMREIREASVKSPEIVTEFFQQVDPSLSLELFATRLRVARRLRWMLLELVTKGERSYEFVSPSMAATTLFTSRSTATSNVEEQDAERQNEKHGCQPLDWTDALIRSLISEGNEERALDYDRERPISTSPASHFGLLAPRDWSNVQKEALFLYQLIDFLWCPEPPEQKNVSKDGATLTFRERVARLFYLYCLIWMANGQALLVQTPDQKGFDQFQKITLGGLREDSEKDYRTRFFQLARYAPLPDLTVLEGRFAPKSSHARSSTLLTAVRRGYDDYIREARTRDVKGVSGNERERGGELVFVPGRHSGAQSMDLRLVAHFVKLEDMDFLKYQKERASGRHGDREHLGRLMPKCRWEKLRENTATQLRILLERRERDSWFFERLVGIDGASNELHAPPEVFAPTYRAARRAGIKGFTYHVGEDFLHLVSGLRAMEEAIDFLDLRNGDRLGHGTAAGIEPTLWLERMPESVVMPVGEWLDNLVFAYHCFSENSEFVATASRCESAIARTLSKAYGTSLERRRGDSSAAHVPPEVLRQAWSLRRLDALLLEHIAEGEGPLRQRSFRRRNDDCARSAEDYVCEPSEVEGFDSYAWKTELVHRLYVANDDEAAEIALLLQEAEGSPEAFERFQRYHDFDTSFQRSQMLEVETGFFSAEELRYLQRYILKCVREKGIVLEVLPTSNLRISFYHHIGEHHVYRWLGFTGEEKVPVVVGSDDPGIFNTSMRLEYELLRYGARTHYGKSDTETIQMLSELVENSHRYAFRRSAWADDASLGSLGRESGHNRCSLPECRTHVPCWVCEMLATG